MIYTLGLKTGGLMEDPEWQVKDIKTVTADTLWDAKAQYASRTGLDKKPHWDAKSQTYFGWPIVQIIK
jgi:hypothetical protein